MDSDRAKQLQDFVTYAKSLDGDEKGEAQVFLDRLFKAFSRNGYKEAGAKLELDAYGFSAKKDLLKPLLDLNLAVAKAIEKGEEVTAPGVPKGYGDAKGLITEDCIKP
ncbi:MAG: hypothetical protein ACREJD_04045 [Phycisphaerales bacterium]